MFPQGTKYKNLTASGQVKAGPGTLVGMYVNSTSSGTIKFWDDPAAANTVMNNTITPAVGWHDLGAGNFKIACYATIGGTLDVTIYYE